MKEKQMQTKIEPVSKTPSQEVGLYTASKLLGHKNIATTTRYAHLKMGHLKEAINKVATGLGERQTP